MAGGWGENGRYLTHDLRCKTAVATRIPPSAIPAGDKPGNPHSNRKITWAKTHVY
ncbi:MAG: hypothetical protein R3C62_08620 [Chloroflexota bacterium]